MHDKNTNYCWKNISEQTRYKNTEKFIYYYVLQRITTEAVTIKFQENVLEEIDKSISKNNFNSRTEFVREAVRDKLSELSKENLIKEFLKFRGKAKRKTTYEDNKKTRELVSKELMAELKKRFT